jgi:hypothetical protein
VTARSAANNGIDPTYSGADAALSEGRYCIGSTGAEFFADFEMKLRRRRRSGLSRFRDHPAAVDLVVALHVHER